MRFPGAVVGLVLAGVAGAQAGLHFEFRYPPPPATWQASNNVIPFGTSGIGNFDHARWQQIIPSGLIPPLRCRIEGMALTSTASFAITDVEYATLHVHFSAADRLALQEDYDDNLLAPMQVFGSATRTIAWRQKEPTRVAFEQGFPHDGVSHLVLDIRKDIDPGAATYEPRASGCETATIPATWGIPKTLACFGAHGSDVVHGEGRRARLAMHIACTFTCLALENFGAQRLAGPDHERLRIGCVSETSTLGALRIGVQRPTATEEGSFALGIRVLAGDVLVTEIRMPTCADLLGVALRIERADAEGPRAWSKPISPRLGEDYPHPDPLAQTVVKGRRTSVRHRSAGPRRVRP